MRWCVYVRCVLCVCLVVRVDAVPLRLFYPYGESRGDETLDRGDDVSSQEIQLTTPMFFYDGFYPSVFVNSNGHLSFESELPGYQPTMVMPLGREIKLIAAYMADIDLSDAGQVFYRETNDEALLQRAGMDVQAHFSQFPSFEPLGLFIATWEGVVPYGSQNTSQVNTFQIVVASDALNSFAIFNYLDGGLVWSQSRGKFADSGSRDPPAQAGFDSGDSLHKKLPHSGTDQVTRLAVDSNANLPGMWMHHIGNTKGSNVAAADLNTGDVVIFEPQMDQNTCHSGRRQCHTDALCTDYETGFCCHCAPPAYGNGRQCVQPEAPQRLGGKVSGTINGVAFSDLDMHSFVVTKDGRAYTAVSRIPAEVSVGLMTLNTIGGLIGWMFALIGGPGAKNGYMYTGGSLNRTARIRFQRGGEVVITQRFLGHNVLNNILMETNVRGDVPNFGEADRITVDDYKEEYRKVRRGVIESTSDRTFRLNEVAYQYSWNQTITFDECEHAPAGLDGGGNYMRLSVSRNYINYDPNERVVRYAMSNKVNAMTGSDPCQEGAASCDRNAACLSDGDTFRCECRTGFIGDGRTCQDLDECATVNTCDANADCVNTVGSFTCRCRFGYVMTGRTCTRDVALCGGVVCDDNANCVFNDVTNTPMCECKVGFAGDGKTCKSVHFDCNEADICHANAECVFSDVEERYVCECTDGFSGDGQYCDRLDIENRCDECDRNAECIYDINNLVFRCVCKQGYTGSGTTCTKIDQPDLAACDDCHPNAACVFSQDSQRYRCVCAVGYQGDGTRCSPAYDCRSGNVCDVNARCDRDASGNHVCVCERGYYGDGRRCEPEGCNVANNCDVNARCVTDPRDTRRYICRCNPGFSGDGTVCIMRVIACNEVNNCSPDAQCVYDPQSSSYRCRCNRGFEGDGITCRYREVDCNSNPSMCDPNAVCVEAEGRYSCICRQGYQGDGRRCEALPDVESYLVFSRGYSIHKVPTKQNGDHSDGSRVLYLPDELAVAVAADCAEQKFYWTDVKHGRISRADLNGFNKDVVINGFSSPEGLAVDWMSRNLYVTDSTLDLVAVVNMNGTYRKTLINTELRDPRSIVVSPMQGVMFWTDWFRNKPVIEAAYMDGSDRHVFVETGLGLPNGLAYDPYSRQLCWGDAGVNKIECVQYGSSAAGLGRRVVMEKVPYPFDLAIYGSDIFWSDWTIRGIPHVDRVTGEEGKPLSLPVGGNGRLYGVTAIGSYCPARESLQRFGCALNNGGCRYLCLPKPNGGRTCSCPDDIDSVTCEEIATLTKKKK
ncbi:nidogen-1-like [Dreissena polymorpha]|nr:nidogen-1-like [Dreissena polymorpha]